MRDHETRILGPLLAALLTTAFAAGCGEGGEVPWPEAGAEGAVDAAVEVTRVTFGVEPGSGADGVFFGPEDELLARVEVRGRSEGATLLVDWQDEDGEVVGHSSRTIAVDGVETTEFHLTRPDRWPAGTYELEVWLDGRLATTRSFTVQVGD